MFVWLHYTLIFEKQLYIVGYSFKNINPNAYCNELCIASFTVPPLMIFTTASFNPRAKNEYCATSNSKLSTWLNALPIPRISSAKHGVIHEIIWSPVAK